MVKDEDCRIKRCVAAMKDCLCTNPAKFLVFRGGLADAGFPVSMSTKTPDHRASSCKLLNSLVIVSSRCSLALEATEVKVLLKLETVEAAWSHRAKVSLKSFSASVIDLNPAHISHSLSDNLRGT